MSLDLDFEDAQSAVADAVRQFCAAECDESVVRECAGTFPRALWLRLAGLGVLEAGGPGDEAGPIEVCAVVEALGHAAFPGPLAATFLARRVLPEPTRSTVATGEAIVSYGVGDLAAFAADADVFIQSVAGRLHRATPRDAVEPVATLGGEPWGRARFEIGERLEDDGTGRALHAMAQAAYLGALAARLTEEASAHARVRKQFGRSIGEFQGVAHPLADVHMRTSAARALARAAACRLAAFDAPGGASGARDAALRGVLSAASLAVLSARGAALDAVHTAHQVFGAIGITLEGPVFHLSRRARQLASEAPGPDAARANVLESLGLGEAAA